MKTREYVQVQNSSAAALVLAILAAVMSAAALAVGIVALVKSCAGKRVTAAEYSGYVPSDEDDDEENLGSDTLAF